MKHRLHNFSALLRCRFAGNIPATQQEKILVKTAPRALAKWRGGQNPRRDIRSVMLTVIRYG
jgi:hypothetical protein